MARNVIWWTSDDKCHAYMSLHRKSNAKADTVFLSRIVCLSIRVFDNAAAGVYNWLLVP